MRLIALAAGVAALLSIFAVPAQSADKGGVNGAAADLGIPAPTRKWTGIYFGGQVGGSLNSNVTNHENIPAALGVGARLSQDLELDNKLIGGMHFGAMKQFGVLVLGLDLEVNGSNSTASAGNCFGIAGLVGGGTTVQCQTDLNWLASGVGRIGIAGSYWLAYLQGGYAFAGLDHNISATIPPLGGLSLSNGRSDVADGFVYGLGASVQVTQDWIFSLDWKRYQLEADTAGLVLGGIASSGNSEVDIDAITGRLSIKLN